MKRRFSIALAAAGFCFGLLCGCASYYKVTDPQSGRVYYTQEMEGVRGGAVKLKDPATGSVVTLQNSEVKEITSTEYKEGLAAAAKPQAPAAAPAAAPAMNPAPAAAAPAAAAPAEPAPASAPTETK